MLKLEKLMTVNCCAHKIMINVKTFKINMSDNTTEYISSITARLIYTEKKISHFIFMLQCLCQIICDVLFKMSSMMY